MERFRLARYNVECEQDDLCRMKQDAGGAWVRYRDFDAEISAAQKRIEELKDAIGHYLSVCEDGGDPQGRMLAREELFAAIGEGAATCIPVTSIGQR